MSHAIPDTNSNPSAWSDSYQKRIALLTSKANEAADHLSKLFIYLQSLDPRLAELRVEYDGCGDSGTVEDISYIDRQGKPLSIDDSQPLPDDIAQGHQHNHGDWVPGEGWRSSGDRVNLSAHNLIDVLAWDLAYGKHPGFEINEGGYGTITITNDIDYPNQVTVKLSHSERFIQTTDYEYEL